MAVNSSKAEEARFWKKWIEAGAVRGQGSKLHYCMAHSDGILTRIDYKKRITPESKNADKIVSPLEFTITRITVDFPNGGGEGTQVYFDLPDSYVGKPVEVLHSYWFNNDGSHTEGKLLSSNGKVVCQQNLTHTFYT